MQCRADVYDPSTGCWKKCPKEARPGSRFCKVADESSLHVELGSLDLGRHDHLDVPDSVADLLRGLEAPEQMALPATSRARGGSPARYGHRERVRRGANAHIAIQQRSDMNTSEIVEGFVAVIGAQQRETIERHVAVVAGFDGRTIAPSGYLKSVDWLVRTAAPAQLRASDPELADELSALGPITTIRRLRRAMSLCGALTWLLPRETAKLLEVGFETARRADERANAES